MHIPIDLLKTFVVVADTRNLTLAGKQICRSQSAVSMQIKRLTEIVEKPLIEMEEKKNRLSPLGEEAAIPRIKISAQQQNRPKLRLA